MSVIGMGGRYDGGFSRAAACAKGAGSSHLNDSFPETGPHDRMRA